MTDTQPLAPTDAEIIALADETRTAEGGANGYILPISFCRAVIAKWGTPPAVAGEPVAWMGTYDKTDLYYLKPPQADVVPLYATPQPTQAQAVAIPLTDREIELIDGMIQVQLDHASRCDAIANRSMADKQKGWDMERVALLQKIKAHGIKGGQHGAE